MTLRLFVEVSLQVTANLALPAGAARHAQVRRVQPGDALVLFDGLGGEWHATVLSMGRSEVVVTVHEHLAVDRELPLHVTLAIGAPANDRMDILVEKATELGVARVLPLLCERSVLRLGGERAERKREHCQAVAVAASEQCGRCRVPRVDAMVTFERGLADLPPGGERWLLSPASSRPLVRPEAGTRVVVLSGPEGGLSPDEETVALRAGFEAVSLGPRVLRAETAPLAVLAWLGLDA
jgi:16S rRNA (uracil1498-N3)-methyltransferase